MPWSHQTIQLDPTYVQLHLLQRSFLRLYVDHLRLSMGIATFKLTREVSLGGIVRCDGRLCILRYWRHRGRRPVVSWLLPLLGSAVWAVRALRCDRRLLARGVIAVLFADAEGHRGGVLLHVGMVLGRLRRSRVRRVGVLLVGCGTRCRNASRGGSDVLVARLVLLAAHEEESKEAYKCETEDRSNNSAGDPSFAFALLLNNNVRHNGV
jgi:hypothetical protein